VPKQKAFFFEVKIDAQSFLKSIVGYHKIRYKENSYAVFSCFQQRTIPASAARAFAL
jgi:hypothetical protein